MGEVRGEDRKEEASGQGKKMGHCMTPIKCGELRGSGRRVCVKVTVMGLLLCRPARSVGRVPPQHPGLYSDHWLAPSSAGRARLQKHPVDRDAPPFPMPRCYHRN